MGGTNKNQPSTRHYAIDNAWLDIFAGDEDAYVDIMEIRTDPSQSAYLQWLVARGTLTEEDYVREQQRASFEDNGIRVGNTTDGNDVRGWMRDEAYIDTSDYLATLNHPDVWRRIYANGTTARRIWFMGFGSRLYDNTGHTTINQSGVVQ